MKISSYNIKCLVIYILYCLFFFFIGEGTFFDDDIKNYVFQYIGIPLITYLLLPFVLKLIGDWKIVRWIDGAIDYVYRSIKEPGKQHAFRIEKSTLSSDDTTTKKSHWIWKVLMFYIVVALMGDALTSCGSERHESRSSALSLSDASFLETVQLCSLLKICRMDIKYLLFIINK